MCKRGCTPTVTGILVAAKGLEPHVVVVVTIKADWRGSTIALEDAGYKLLFVGRHRAFAVAEMVVVAEAEALRYHRLCHSDVGMGHTAHSIAETDSHADGLGRLEVWAVGPGSKSDGIDRRDDVASRAVHLDQSLTTQAAVTDGAVADDAERECCGRCHGCVGS